MSNTLTEEQALEALRDQVLKFSPEGWTEARELVNQYFLTSNSCAWSEMQVKLLDGLLRYREIDVKAWPQHVAFFFNTLPYKECQLWQNVPSGSEHITYTEALIKEGDNTILRTLHRHQLLPPKTHLVRGGRKYLEKCRKLFYGALCEGASGNYLEELLRVLECDFATILDEKIIKELATPDMKTREDLQEFIYLSRKEFVRPIRQGLWWICFTSLCVSLKCDVPWGTIASIVGLIVFR